MIATDGCGTRGSGKGVKMIGNWSAGRTLARAAAHGLLPHRCRRTLLLAVVAAQLSGAALGQDDLLLAPSGGDDLLAPAGDSLLLVPADGDDLLSSTPTGGDDLLAPLPTAGDDPLAIPGVADPATETDDGAEPASAFKQHEALFAESRFPSATTCATCHPKHFEEWAVSQHAYAQLSPVFVSMQAAINALTSGTNGDFCIRCHTPVGMNLDESVYVSNLERHPTSREGVTCIACHRVTRNYGRISGRLAIEEGDLFDPVYGPSGNAELERVLQEPETYRVVTDRGESGRAIHTEARRFFPLITPGFCGSCHDVTLVNGFRLEEAFTEYKRTPAARRGVTCQDCHMGTEQGVESGYARGPAAVVGGVPTQDRKLTNHYFAGPDHSILHPGLFPLNVEAQEFKTMAEWLEFDVAAGWGTDAFENSAPVDYPFPDSWISIDDRYDARSIIDYQQERLAWADEQRLEVLQNGLGLGEITVAVPSRDGFTFTVPVHNLTDGHGVPTGFDAERLMFLEVTVTDADGRVVFVSGDRDPNGDVRDLHSAYVHDGRLPLDGDLFNLQSKFAVRLLRGGEREQILPINTSLGVLPFVRPETRATTIYGRPRTARKHKQTIDPLSHRDATYRVDGDHLTGQEPYTVSVRLQAQMVPVNLIAAIQFVGFDYGMSPREVAAGVVDGTMTIDEARLEVYPSRH